MGENEKYLTDFAPGNGPEDEARWALLSVYADGEATPDETRQVESLLRSDTAWKREYDLLRLASSFARTEPELAPPAELRDRIFAATISRPTLRRRFATAWADFAASLTPRYALAGGFAGAALLTVALWPHNHKVEAPQQAAQAAPPSPQIAAPSASTPKIAPEVINAARTAAKIAASVPETAKKTPAQPIIKTEGTTAEAKTSETKKARTLAAASVAAGTKIAASARPVKHSAAPRPSALTKAPQIPAPVDPDTPVVIAASYVPRPDMNINNQRPAPIARAPRPDSEMGDGVAESSAPTKPVRTAEADAPAGPQRWVGKIKPSVLDNARQMTPGFMRRQRQASNSGYNDLIISSMKQNQMQVAVEGRF